MGAYGKYSTRYRSCSDQELFVKYRRENWIGLSEEEKLDLYQETVNRHAASLGEIGAPRVCIEKMNAKTVGTHADGVIKLNSNIVIHGVQETKIGGQIFAYEREDAGMQAMMACFHENLHAWQEQCLDGTIVCPDQELFRQYKANDFDIRAVTGDDGTIKMGSQYLKGDPGSRYYMYYFQATERDAHRFSEYLTVSVMDQLEQIYGPDEGFQAFREDLAVNGYDAILKEAQEFHRNMEIEKDINRTLMNTYYGTCEPVDPETKRLVEQEMIQSCNEIYHMRQQKIEHVPVALQKEQERSGCEYEHSLGEDGGYW